jgi:hypothetical protein
VNRQLMTRGVSATLFFVAVISAGMPIAIASASVHSQNISKVLLASSPSGTGCDGPPPVLGEHCVPLSVSISRQSESANGNCSAILYMQLTLNNKIVEYDATWTPPNQPNSPRPFTATGGPNGTGSGPFGDEEIWSTKEVGYAGIVHKVPKGSGAWLLGAGGGPAPCTDLGKGVAQAWGWTAHPVVSGVLSIQGSGGQPAVGVTVKAKCSSGGSTISDISGAYGFILDQGSCTIAPKVPASALSIPKERVVSVSTQDIKNVNFQVPGGPLKVTVKQIQTLRSGLAIHSVHYKDYPADFTTVVPAGTTTPAHFVCESGCVDITVNVVDPSTHKAPDPKASVDVSLGTLHASARTFGDGILCETGPDGKEISCDTSITGLQTDSDGNVHLRYWAPGVLDTADSALTVTASCKSKPCTASSTTSHTTLKVKPYLIYDNVSALTDEDVHEMDVWAGGPDGFNKFLETSLKGFDTLKIAILAVEKAEIAAKTAKEALEKLEVVEPIAKVLDVGLKLNEAFEAQGMFSLFLKNSGLSPFGIGTDPFEATASGDPSPTFVREMMNQLAVPSILKIGNGGFWWASAEAIRRHNSAPGPTSISQETSGAISISPEKWSLDTMVYEVSHCDIKQGPCGPGYGNSPGSDIDINTGIEPNLVMQLALRLDGQPIEKLTFEIKYDALAWTTTQPDLLGVIKDF